MSYKWDQGNSSLTVQVPAPPGITKKTDVDVMVTPTGLRIGFRGGPPVLEVSIQLV